MAGWLLAGWLAWPTWLVAGWPAGRRAGWLAGWLAGCSLAAGWLAFVFPSHLAPSKLPKCHYRLFCRPDLRPRSYQSVSAFAFPSHLVSLFIVFVHPTCALGVSCPTSVLRSRSCQSVTIYCFSQPVCALEVTKVSLLSWSLAVLRPRSYKVSLFVDFSSRPALLKLSKCR